ncbi:MAG: hypothetical protein IJC39_01765, partial [Firmicutes bacterium]|nr:hypothetical protein [Bacillota bacterium]
RGSAPASAAAAAPAAAPNQAESGKKKKLQDPEKETIKNRFGEKGIGIFNQLQDMGLGRNDKEINLNYNYALNALRKRGSIFAAQKRTGNDSEQNRALGFSNLGFMERTPRYRESMLNAFKRESSDWVINRLTTEEAAVVLDYTSDNYVKYNDAANGKTDDPDYEKFKQRGDILSGALGKYKPPVPMHLFKLVSEDRLKSMIVDSGVASKLGKFDKDEDEFKSRIRQHLVGKKLRHGGFMSTSVNDKIEFQGYKIMLSIDVPAGAKGAPLMEFSAHSHEDEFLLDRGQVMEVTGARSLANRSGYVIIDVRLITESSEEDNAGENA